MRFPFSKACYRKTVPIVSACLPTAGKGLSFLSAAHSPPIMAKKSEHFVLPKNMEKNVKEYLKSIECFKTSIPQETQRDLSAVLLQCCTLLEENKSGDSNAAMTQNVEMIVEVLHLSKCYSVLSEAFHQHPITLSCWRIADALIHHGEIGVGISKWIESLEVSSGQLLDNWSLFSQKRFMHCLCVIGGVGSQAEVESLLTATEKCCIAGLRIQCVNGLVIGAMKYRNTNRFNFLFYWAAQRRVVLFKHVVKRFFELVRADRFDDLQKKLGSVVPESCLAEIVADVSIQKGNLDVLSSVEKPTLSFVTFLRLELGGHKEIEQRRFVDWECALCGTSNLSVSKSCRGCGSGPVPRWKCFACEHLNVYSNVDCIVCKTSRASSVKVLADKSWRCPKCEERNFSVFRPRCEYCGHDNPFLAPPSPLQCRDCGHENRLGIQHPWCDLCGAVHSLAEVDPTLWKCNYCAELNPWTELQCRVCWGANHSSEQCYYQSFCRECGFHFPAWLKCCAHCHHVAETRVDIVGATQCERCGAPLLDSLDECLACNASGTPHSYWLCLVRGCFEMNELRDKNCHCCGTTYDERRTIREVDTYLCDEAISVNVTSLTFEKFQHAVCQCGTNLEPFCIVCPTCHQSSRSPSCLDHWMTLRVIACLLKSESVKSISAVQYCYELVHALCISPASSLPWQSRDIIAGEFAVSPRIPVHMSGKIHSAVDIVRFILQRLCDAGTKSAGDAGKERLSLIIRMALDLIDVVNESSEFDEIGFDVLAEVCKIIRPEQETHIYGETRMEYLLKAKLTRQDILNGVTNYSSSKALAS